MTPTDLQWKVYHLFHRDHENMTVEEVAAEMQIDKEVIEEELLDMEVRWPELFRDISSDRRRFDKNVERYNEAKDGEVKRKF